jgi:hypothetical protein
VEYNTVLKPSHHCAGRRRLVNQQAPTDIKLNYHYSRRQLQFHIPKWILEQQLTSQINTINLNGASNELGQQNGETSYQLQSITKCPIQMNHERFNTQAWGIFTWRLTTRNLTSCKSTACWHLHARHVGHKAFKTVDSTGN